MLSETIEYFSSTTTTELLAVIASIAYVVLAARGSLWCWPAAMISTVLYTLIFYDVYLWSDSALQIYYFAMAIYGWLNWYKNKHQGTKEHVPNNSAIKIVKRSKAYHIKAITLLTFFALALGYLMSEYTPTHFPYLDAATTVFALFATYLVTQRVLENWLYWVIIDLVSIYLYQAKSLNPTAALFIIYVVIATIAYFNWRKSYQAQMA